MYIDERIMSDLGFDRFVSNLFAQGEELSRQPVAELATASEDLSYEMNDAALLRVENGAYIIIHAQSCSCWPYMGGADVYENNDMKELVLQFKDGTNRYLGEELISDLRQKGMW